MTQWLSVHLHFDGSIFGDECDRLLLEVVKPIVACCEARCWSQRWFFVRYSEGGSHVRLRIAASVETLEEKIELLVADYSESSGIVTRVEWVPYEPELERYGGTLGVALAEYQFIASSRTALDLIGDWRAQRDGDRRVRLGKALLAMLVQLHAFSLSRARATTLAEAYHNGYLHRVVRHSTNVTAYRRAFDAALGPQEARLVAYVNEAWCQLDNVDNIPASLRHLAVAVRDVAERLKDLQRDRELALRQKVPTTWDDAIALLIPSYLHMTNNKLGIDLSEESYLGHILLHSLSPGKVVSERSGEA